jgi:hypothetical protein
LVVHLSLSVSGCAARQHRVSDLSTTVTRMDDNAGPGEPAAQDSCDLGVAVTHPETEAAQYDIEVTNPGDGGEGTTTTMVFCRSDGDNVGCEVPTPPAEHDAAE